MTASFLERRYLVSGAVLSLRSHDPEMCADFDSLLACAAIGAEAKPSYLVEARRGIPTAPDAAVVFEGEVPGDGFCVMRQAGEETHLSFPGLQSLTLYPGERRAEVVVDPTAGQVAWTAWMMVLEAALDAAGLALLHAAGLRIPGSDKAILLYAPSGTGKSTTALAMARAGFGLLADDAVVIGEEKTAWTAWGLPRAAKIHRHTAVMLPFLEPALRPRWDRNGEQAVALADLGRLLPVEPAIRMPVAAVVELARGKGPASVVKPATRVDILASLAADNVRLGRTGLLPQHRRKLEIISRMTAAVPVLRLEAGADLSDLGPVMLAALSEQAPRDTIQLAR